MHMCQYKTCTDNANKNEADTINNDICRNIIRSPLNKNYFEMNLIVKKLTKFRLFKLLPFLVKQVGN